MGRGCMYIYRHHGTRTLIFMVKCFCWVNIPYRDHTCILWVWGIFLVKVTNKFKLRTGQPPNLCLCYKVMFSSIQFPFLTSVFKDICPLLSWQNSPCDLRDHKVGFHTHDRLQLGWQILEPDFFPSRKKNPRDFMWTSMDLCIFGGDEGHPKPLRIWIFLRFSMVTGDW